MTKEEFKQRWESEEDDEITFFDIRDCAKEWGISAATGLMLTDPIAYKVITYKVLKAAGCDAEQYKPEGVELTGDKHGKT